MAESQAIDQLHLAPEPPLGAQLRMRRLADGKSQTELAATFGVTQQTVGTWERGGRPEPKYFAMLAEYIGMEDKEKVLALLESHSPRPGTQVVVDSIDLDGLTNNEVLRKITSSFLAQKSSGVQLSDAEASVYAELIRVYRELGDSARSEPG